MCSSSLATPTSPSEVLTDSSHSLPLKDRGVSLRRILRDGWLFGTCSDINLIRFRRSNTVDIHLNENKTPEYLIHLDHIFTVSLLRDITKTSSDVNSPADVHVHFHGFLLDFGVQIRQILQRAEQSIYSKVIGIKT